MSRPRSQVKINFPPWYGNGRNPYRAHREIDQALDSGDSLDASKRVADDCRLRINNDDFSTRPLLVKAVELRRADVIQFLVDRGADLNHVWDFGGDNIESSLLWASIQSGRYSDAVFLLDVGAAVNGRESYARDRTPLMRAAELASLSWVPNAPERLAMVRLLLSRGANLDAVDTYGHTADQIASDANATSIGSMGVITHKTLAPGETLLVDTNSLVSWEDSVEFDVRTTGGCCTCCCAGEGLFNTKLTGPGEVFLQSYSHGKFKNYAIEWCLAVSESTS